jgi:hypothetical protein
MNNDDKISALWRVEDAAGMFMDTTTSDEVADVCHWGNVRSTSSTAAKETQGYGCRS